MRKALTILFCLGSLSAQKAKPPASAPIGERLPDSDIAPVEEVTEPALAPAEDPAKLFQKGFKLGWVADSTTGPYRRLIQRIGNCAGPSAACGADYFLFQRSCDVRKVAASRHTADFSSRKTEGTGFAAP
jgi:hypothetical protein